MNKRKFKSCITILQPQLENEVYVDGELIAVINHMNGLDRVKWIKYIKAQGIISSLELLKLLSKDDLQLAQVLLGLHIIKWMVLNKLLWAFNMECTFDNLLLLDDVYKTPLVTLLIKVYTLAMSPDLSISKN